MSTETCDEIDGKNDVNEDAENVATRPDTNGLTIRHVRSKSAPALHHKNGASKWNGQVSQSTLFLPSAKRSSLHYLPSIMKG